MAHKQEADDLEEGCYVWFGTPITDESTAKSSAYRKPVLDPGKTRAAPVTQQEPTDEQGRKRFHGAFTGGFSAGYFNTVGSKEGFQPGAFRSSRSDRAAVKAQSLDDFLDEDEKQEREKVTLLVKGDFDTFGSGAAEAARGVSQRDAAARPSLIPGPAIEELITPVAEGKGVRLLMKMGWRPGRGVASAPADASGEAGRRSRWGTVSGVSLDNTPLYVLEPKQDVHGLGFDPFSGAEDFRELKQRRVAGRQEELRQAAADATSKLGIGGGGRGGVPGAKRPRGVAFAGFTEDSGMYGYMDDYVDEDEEAAARPTKQSVLTGGTNKGFNYELGDSGSDEENGAPGRRRPLLLEAGDKPAPLMLQTAAQLRKGGDFIPGFVKSGEQVVQPVYAGPLVPPDWVEHHTFPPTGVAVGQQGAALPPPPEVSPPADPDLRRAIDSLAAMVARSGKAVEALALKQARAAQQQGDPGRTGSAALQGDGKGQAEHVKYDFLLGGEGSQYYLWRLHKIRTALAMLSGTSSAAAGPEPGTKPGGGAAEVGAGAARRGALSVEQRMALLGEEALPSTQAAQQALAAAQRAMAGQQAAQAPRVAEGDRQRLQEAMSSMFVKADDQDMGGGPGQHVGLRAGGAAAAPAQAPPSISGAAAAVLAGFGNRFTSSGASETLGAEARAAGLLQGSAVRASAQSSAPAAKALPPKRWFEDWRPEPLVCKRFNVPDPYKGKPMAPAMSKFKSDYIALPETSAGLTALQHTPQEAALQLPPPPPLLASSQQLPGPPPFPADMQAAVARATAIAQQLTAQGGARPPIPEPPPAPALPARLDAKAYAANFLTTLLVGDDTMDEGAPIQQAAEAEAALNAGTVGAPVQPGVTSSANEPALHPSADFPSSDRPLDIFKAIFEAEDEQGEEDETQAGAEQAPSAFTTTAPEAQASRPAHQATAQQAGLASALLRAQQMAAEKAAQAQFQQQAQVPDGLVGPSLPPVPGPAPAPAAGGGSAGGLAVDPEVQQRILAALGMIKRSNKEKDKQKDRDKKKSKKQKKHKSKSDKSKGDKSKKSKYAKKKSAKPKVKRRGASAGPPSGNGSSSESGSGSPSSDESA